MGQAKQRGTYEQRKTQALSKKALETEVRTNSKKSTDTTSKNYTKGQKALLLSAMFASSMSILKK